MEFPESFEQALRKYEDKFFQLKNKKLTLTKENFDEVIRANFHFLAFICFYGLIEKLLEPELKESLHKIVQEVYYSKFNKEISLTEMMTPEGYSYNLEDEPLFKTSILY